MSRPIQKRRIVYIGPVGAGVLGVCGALPMVGLGLAFERIDSPETAAVSVVLTGLAFVVGAWLFNMLGPMMGGLHIWLAPPRPAPVDKHAPVQTCPRCGTETPRTRSFCRQCDYDFEPAKSPPEAAEGGRE